MTFQPLFEISLKDKKNFESNKIPAVYVEYIATVELICNIWNYLESTVT